MYLLTHIVTELGFLSNIQCTHTHTQVHTRNKVKLTFWHAAGHCVTRDWVHWELLCQHTTVCTAVTRTRAHDHSRTHRHRVFVSITAISIIYKNSPSPHRSSFRMQMRDIPSHCVYPGARVCGRGMHVCVCAVVCCVLLMCWMCCLSVYTCFGWACLL